jgi:hypothetical protein
MSGVRLRAVADEHAGTALCQESPGREDSKAFFSEEKNQKTFAPSATFKFEAMAGIVPHAQNIKVFCFFSSEKKSLA